VERDVLAKSCKILQGGSDKIQLILLKLPRKWRHRLPQVIKWFKSQLPSWDVPMIANDIQWHPMICWFLCFHILPDCIRRQNLAQQANPWAASAIESILAWISLVSLSESWASLGRRLDPIFAFFLDSVLRLKDRFGGRASAGEGRVRDSPH